MENIRLAFQGIWGHKMRSMLTMLGIIIGISAIITIVSTIKGTNEQIKENLVGAGSNVVTVRLYQDEWEYDFAYSPLPPNVRPIDEATRRQLEELPHVSKVSLYNSYTGSEGIFAGANMFTGEVCGIDLNYMDVYGYLTAYGRSFTQRDFDQYRKVAVVDRKAATALFGQNDPLGGVVEIKGEPFVVVGVVEQDSSFQPAINTYQDYMMYADNSAGRVFIPNSVWPVPFRFDQPQSVAVKANSTDDMTKAGQAVADLLNKTQIVTSAAAVPEGEEQPEQDGAATKSGIAYRSQDLLQQAQQLQEMSNSTNQQLIWIASISLLVGGIGVMNIMLVSVTERTSEIGLKKALGAKKKRIRRQFLTEASVLTSLGGVIGVVLGIGLAQVISIYNQIPVAISVPAIVVSVVFSMVIGIVFGLLPAVKAANLNPIEALRRD